MNQRPMENKPLSSSKPSAYIPPVKRPGQIPPLQQPPVQPLQKQILAENESPLQKSGPQNMSDPRIGSNVSTPQTDPPVSQPASVSGPGTVPAAKQTVPAAAEGGSKMSSAPKDSQAIPPGYYRPIPRKQRADYQYLAKRSLSSKGSAAVLFSFLFCSVFSELVLWGNLGLSVLILTLSYHAFSFWYFYDCKRRFSSASLSMTLPISVLAIGLCLAVSPSTYFITVPFFICLLAAQTALLAGMPYRSFFSWETFVSLWAHLVDGPLSFLDFPFLVMRGRGKEEKKSKSFWKIFLGIVCALPVVALLLWLFASADAVFRTGLQHLAQWFRIDWTHLFSDLLLGFLGGIFLSATLLYCRGALPKKPNPVGCKRFLDPLFVVPFLGLIDLSVLAFTFVQFAYLFGGEKGSLPGGYTYAEYARQGFFELAAALSFIFLISLFSMSFCKTERRCLSNAVRLELLLLNIGGGVVLCSAVKRMLLYVDVYGLSVKRGLTLWFMVTAGICFLFLAVRCLWRRFPLAKCVGIAITAMICLLSLFPMDGFIAQYNVNAYLSGHTETEVDYYYLKNLSVSAIPAMVDLYLHEPSDDLAWAIDRQIQKNERRHPIWGWTADQIGIQKSIHLFRQAKGEISRDAGSWS